MKDFPLFTTENGVASLTLKEIPYKEEAYIQIHDSLFPERLLEECTSFCIACGAKHVYASGSPVLEQFPLYSAIYELRGMPRFAPDTVCCLWPVTEENAGEWRRIYNEKMRGVFQARTLETKDERVLAEAVGTYFIHDAGRLLGIGWLEENTVKAIASVMPGAGERILNTLISLNPGVSLNLEVVSTNIKAIALYEKFGFLKVKECSRWYQIK